jgi:2-polyprenyl-3-methyl-5-hydroxy-6-metoxy-1,4-benzoquinol methylase
MNIQVANGEIVDKFTILNIKLKNSNNQEKTLNVPQELVDELQKVNQKIWDTEDGIRLCEKNNQFDDTFIQYARDVYYNNDERFRVKSKINQVTNSYINEQKILPDYQK